MACSASYSMLLFRVNSDDSCEQGGYRLFRHCVERRGRSYSYCQFVVSGSQFNMNFLLLCIQSIVCVSCVGLVKKAGIISFRAFDMKDAKAWFPISFLLVSVIYTGSKSLVSLVSKTTLMLFNQVTM